MLLPTELLQGSRVLEMYQTQWQLETVVPKQEASSRGRRSHIIASKMLCVLTGVRGHIPLAANTVGII